MLRILIADNHEVVRRGIRQILLDEYPFAQIEEVINGQVLVEKALQDHWDLIISDIDMPQMNGLDALKIIRQRLTTLPVLIMSIHSAEQYSRRVLKAGASGYLSKDAAPEELISAVQQILAGRRYLSPSLNVQDSKLQNDRNGRPPHEHLSTRELEVFILIAKGRSLTEIAAILTLDISTVGTYRSRILEKMGMNTNSEIIQYAQEYKLIF